MSTPLMTQYKDIKSQHENSILFFRLGDFYEMFYEDAKIASEVLGITLTARNKEKGEDVPMAGVPHHSAAAYIAKLVNKGYKVAMCEQLSSPKETKGIVKRDVVKTITPGTFSDPDFLDDKSNNFIVSFCMGEQGSAFACLDLTTSEFYTTQFLSQPQKLINEIFRINPKEIVLGVIKDIAVENKIRSFAKINNISLSKVPFNNSSEEYIKSTFNIQSLTSFGLDEKKYATVAAATLLNYVENIQDINGIKRVEYKTLDQFVHLDYSSQENLDLFPQGMKKGSLFGVLDKTLTPMGGRFLKKNLSAPLKNIREIQKRQDDIEFFIINPVVRVDMRDQLKDVRDIERIFSRVVRKEVNARDLNSLKKSLIGMESIVLSVNAFFTVPNETLSKVSTLLQDTILETNTLSIREGGIINPEVNDELLELYNIATKGQGYLLEMEAKEKQETGIKGLKISYNRVFGYYIEVTKSNLSMVPDRYIRKQSLANAERYITEELKEYEEKILNAKDKMSTLEFNLFNELVDKLAKLDNFFSQLCVEISYLDFILSLSEVALKYRYVKPLLKEDGEIKIVKGRHPIVENFVSEFVSNDTELVDNEIIILTGPNMSGKSTYMKQVALIVLMAQIGSFIPAESAEIGLVDKIFTRVGASDDMITGQSTFMVEMSEVANILNNATEKSLIILDEVGRGTSTYDGISIARAMTEYIHDTVKAKTIFATHYHELNTLANSLENVQNYRFEVKELIDKVVFLRKIVEGNADKSYGIEVARLAGLPREVLERSKSLLKEFELEQKVEKKDVFGEESVDKLVIQQLKDLDLDNMTLLELAQKISELKNKI